MIIQAQDIVRRFGKLEVLKGVDFSAEKGEIVAITGASGAGKSTFLQVLGTLLTPDSGKLEIDGFDALSFPRRTLSDFRAHKLGFVFQEHHLLPEFSALENVMLPPLIIGKSKAEARQKARKLLDTVGLGSRIDHKPSELSGGEQQRVAIARALVNAPAVVLADEPTGNLDSVTKQEIHSLFFELREELGQTIVLVTHDPELAGICDRSLKMVDGRF